MAQFPQPTGLTEVIPHCHLTADHRLYFSLSACCLCPLAKMETCGFTLFGGPPTWCAYTINSKHRPVEAVFNYLFDETAWKVSEGHFSPERWEILLLNLLCIRSEMLLNLISTGFENVDLMPRLVSRLCGFSVHWRCFSKVFTPKKKKIPSLCTDPCTPWWKVR